MLLNDEVQMLRRVPMFAGVAPKLLKLLAFTSDRVSYAEGEVLFRQGDPSDSAYVILNGTAEVVTDSPKGPIRVAELGSNAIVGEIGILCDVARTATVQAVDPVEALRIGKDQFIKLLADYPDMTREVIRVLADRLSTTTSELTKARSQAAGVSV
jgi:CRP-like cAMP-binding protein